MATPERHITESKIEVKNENRSEKPMVAPVHVVQQTQQSSALDVSTSTGKIFTIRMFQLKS